MTSLGEWVGGARPRTLPAAVAPVLAGTGAAAGVGAFMPVRALLALVVAGALQVGVNYANDYSDGVRGTDAARVGPVRLVGQGRARPTAVLTAALLCFGVAAIAGLVLVIMTSTWWLLLVGAASIAAAWLYTGGPRPYGYAGLGEVFVLIFFGFVPTMGTTYVQVVQSDRWGEAMLSSLIASLGIGALACAILVANNLRDIPTDAAVGKRTLATRLGDGRTRALYAVLVVAAAVIAVVLGAVASWWCLFALAALVLAVRPLRVVRSGALGRDLVPVLKDTGMVLLAYGVLLAFGLW